jgi:hypothetical protein
MRIRGSLAHALLARAVFADDNMHAPVLYSASEGARQ